jgi:uncharacterized protein with PQ loop repeat
VDCAVLVLTRVVTVVGTVEFVISLAAMLPQPMKDIEIKDNAIIKNTAFFIKILLIVFKILTYILYQPENVFSSLFNIYRRKKDDLFCIKI